MTYWQFQQEIERYEKLIVALENERAELTPDGGVDLEKANRAEELLETIQSLDWDKENLEDAYLEEVEQSCDFRVCDDNCEYFSWDYGCLKNSSVVPVIGGFNREGG